MSEDAPGQAGGPPPRRQHAYPTPVAPPRDRPAEDPRGGGWNRPGPASHPPPGNGGNGGGAPGWGVAGAAGNGRTAGSAGNGWGQPGPAGGGPGAGGPGTSGAGGGGWWRGGGRAAPAPRRSSGVRGLIWAAVAVAVVVLLLHAHRISTGQVIFFCILIPSVILHEVSHGVVAWAFGDDTARRAGRLSLNPLRHVDLVGTIIVPAITVLSGFGIFGWAKPVPVNVNRLRSPRNHGVVVSLAGPFTNLVLAAVFGLIFHDVFVAGRAYPAVTSTAAQVVFDIGLVNLWVACFNLIPIPPLDGSAVVERLLPRAWWPGYLRLRPYGLFVIFGGLLLLSMGHVYPLASIFGHLETWWAHLLL